MTDTRYVYGARCTWHGPISAIGRREVNTLEVDGVYRPHSVPCCPHCNGTLFEYPNKETWDNGVAEFEKKHPGYTEFVEWLGDCGGCWSNLTYAQVMYKIETGKDFSLAAKE